MNSSLDFSDSLQNATWNLTQEEAEASTGFQSVADLGDPIVDGGLMMSDDIIN